jgi:TonB family protein
MALLVLIATVTLGVPLNAVTADGQSKPAREPIRSGFGAGAYPSGTVYPAIQTTKEPSYPSAAIAAGLEGEVLLEAVVGIDGSVTDVRVVKSADATLGLDASAVEAVRTWKFLPGSIAGNKVAAVVKVRLMFHLHTPGTSAGPPATESGLVGDDDGLREPAGRQPSNIYSSSAAGVTEPTVRKSREPSYTSAAMREKIQGSVELELVIGVKGTVTSARVVKSLDARYGLDQQAVKTAKEWTFTPCRLKGQAVPCTITLVLEFKLH